MLRHFKMELKRQQELESQNRQRESALSSCLQQFQLDGQPARPLVMVADTQVPLNMKKQDGASAKAPDQVQAKQQQQQHQLREAPKRVRGRRSSKPQMEKRRRARINECLDILKSYVLKDTSNLNRLGIDLTASENQDEETIARSILKSSGLINRHRGRKNPNKLEKADILELTVDYVRRLHEQRDELSQLCAESYGHQQQPRHHNRCQMYAAQVVPAHLNQPLTLDLSPKSRSLEGRATPPPSLQAYVPPPNTPLTPPSSSGSSSIQSGELDRKHQYQDQMSQMVLSQVLTGSSGGGGKYGREWVLS